MPKGRDWPFPVPKGRDWPFPAEGMRLQRRRRRLMQAQGGTGAGLRTCGATRPIPSISPKSEDEEKGGLVQRLRTGKEVRSSDLGKRESERTGERRCDVRQP